MKKVHREYFNAYRQKRRSLCGIGTKLTTEPDLVTCRRCRVGMGLSAGRVPTAV